MQKLQFVQSFFPVIFRPVQGSPFIHNYATLQNCGVTERLRDLQNRLA